MIENELAIKTICGAIYYTCRQYKTFEIDDRHLNQLASYMQTAIEVYCIEVDATGFVLSTKQFKMRYGHHDFGQRVTEIIPTKCMG